LFLQLVPSRYEHASLILTSNLPFSGWGGVFGDQAVAAPMIEPVAVLATKLSAGGQRTGDLGVGQLKCSRNSRMT
jgi:DNA replication protein DnaC